MLGTLKTSEEIMSFVCIINVFIIEIKSFGVPRYQAMWNIGIIWNMSFPLKYLEFGEQGMQFINNSGEKYGKAVFSYLFWKLSTLKVESKGQELPLFMTYISIYFFLKFSVSSDQCLHFLICYQIWLLVLFLYKRL